MFGLSLLEKLRTDPSSSRETIRSSLASGQICLAGILFASVAENSGPLITTLDAVILPVVLVTVISGPRRKSHP